MVLPAASAAEASSSLPSRLVWSFAFTNVVTAAVSVPSAWQASTVAAGAALGNTGAASKASTMRVRCVMPAR